MKNFIRALRLAFRYRFTLVGAVACSLAVAVLWGGNISIAYPIVKVAFEGTSLQQWCRDEIAVTEKTIAQIQAEIERSDGQGSAAGQQVRLEAEQHALATMRRLQPYVERYVPRDPFQTVMVCMIVLMVGTALKSTFIFSHSMFGARLVQLVTFELRKQFYHHTLRMDLGALGRERSSGLLSRFNVDIGQLSAGIAILFGNALREPLKMIACLAGAAYISWRLLLFSLILTPVVALLIHQLAGSIRRANRRAMEQFSQLFGVLTETFNGMQTVQAYTMEQYERKRFHKVAKDCVNKAMRIVFYNSLTKPASEVLGVGVICLGLVAGSYLVLREETHLLGLRMCDRPMSVTALLAFYAFLVGACDPVRKLTDVFNGVQSGIAAADRIYPVLDAKPVITDPVDPRPVPSHFGRIVLDHVHFHYTADQPVLRDVYLEIKAGETIAIVGPNGCGKTTLANLLPRFIDPVEGAVRLDDVDLRHVKLRELRRRIAMVTQQTLLFDETVLNNIRYGSLSATEAQVHEAARKARAHRFIGEQLENGYQTIVGQGGSRLSGGQRQRISLARAILRNPEILILDEATSQIDLESEQLIHQALEQIVRQRTAIIITHRLSTLALVDRIVVMDAGRVFGTGNHRELSSRCELYQRLHQIQFRQSA